MVKKDSQPAYLERVREIIQRDYRDTITADDLAGEVGVSVSTLEHEFPAYFGITLHRYVNEIRINHAKHLLQQKDYPIYSVAHQVGYNSAAAFSSIFKKVTGHTPKDYRNKKHLEDADLQE
ncbi:MAG TPA: AraC family transcriptional regulator [Puia sp.]|jgi:two-component system response regulator YesN